MASNNAGKKRPDAPVKNGTVDNKEKPTFYELVDMNVWADHKEIVKSASEMVNLAHYQKR